ncbi:MAG: hypothetical protein ABSD98_04380 [Candidatus Korobacteraceae bacterium]|jgi:hypothetical protein
MDFIQNGRAPDDSIDAELRDLTLRIETLEKEQGQIDEARRTAIIYDLVERVARLEAERRATQ